MGRVITLVKEYNKNKRLNMVSRPNLNMSANDDGGLSSRY